MQAKNVYSRKDEGKSLHHLLSFLVTVGSFWCSFLLFVSGPILHDLNSEADATSLDR